MSKRSTSNWTHPFDITRCGRAHNLLLVQIFNWSYLPPFSSWTIEKLLQHQVNRVKFVRNTFNNWVAVTERQTTANLFTWRALLVFGCYHQRLNRDYMFRSFVREMWWASKMVQQISIHSYDYDINLEVKFSQLLLGTLTSRCTF